MCVCLLLFCFGLMKINCTVCVCKTVQLQKWSGEINCLLETLLCFTDNRQVLCVCGDLNRPVHIHSMNPHSAV